MEYTRNSVIKIIIIKTINNLGLSITLKTHQTKFEDKLNALIFHRTWIYYQKRI